MVKLSAGSVQAEEGRQWGSNAGRISPAILGGGGGYGRRAAGPGHWGWSRDDQCELRKVGVLSDWTMGKRGDGSTVELGRRR